MMLRWRSGRLFSAITAGLLIPAGFSSSGAAAASAAAVSVSPAAARPGIISTVIGGPGGPAAATGVSVVPCDLYDAPCALTFANGALYFTSYLTVVDKVSQRTGVLTPVAGSGGFYGPSGPGNGVPALAASLQGACGVTVDAAGNVLVADTQQILAVAAKTGTFYGRRMSAGRIYTLVAAPSGGVAGSSEGPVSYGAVDLQLDRSGNVVFAVEGEESSHTNQEGDSQVFVLAERTGTFYGEKMTRGKLYVIAGTLDGYTLGNGVRATRVDLGYGIGTMRVDSAGNVVLADSGGEQSGAIPGGPPVPPQVRVIANRAGTFYGKRMKAGYIYTIAGGGTKRGDGVPATSVSLPSATAVALDHAGNVLVAAGSVRVIAARSGTFYGQKMTAGHIYTVYAPSASTPALSVAVDNVGNVLVSTQMDVRMLAERTGTYYGKRARAGKVYSIAGNGRIHYSGDGGPATRAELEADAVATDRSDKVTAVADETAGAVRVVAGRTAVFFGRSMRGGYIYTIARGLRLPAAVAFDPAGNVLISEAASGVIQVVADKTGLFYGRNMTAGQRYTIAGGGTETGDGVAALDAKVAPAAVASDPAGDVLLVDSVNIFSGTRVRVVPARTGMHYGQHMIAGDIYTVAGDGNFGQTGDGGPGPAAETEARDITADGHGNLLIADATEVRVVADKTGTFYGRKMLAGYIYPVAGGGTRTGDGTPAAQAFLQPTSIALDSVGNILVGDGDVVWMVAERRGSYYGKSMHAGDVYTVALDNQGTAALGDGGPAIGAALSVGGIAVQSQTGELLIADGYRVRSVSR